VSDEVVISVEHLSKRYRLGETGAGTLKEAFAQWLEKTRRNMPDSRHAEAEEIWALRDVSFEVRRGEVLGVIGRNGAGKSTLLKILTRITEPTSGRAVLRGRAASLLEVGTGFHPDLTGRENIYLNGAILGMKKAEIARKFDEIVAFAELERFIDTPVKRYSSGMYVRLAFAVAAHLEADILLVDEVLAVGDAAFQRKCLNKMAEVTQKGRTVLFVSHNMATIESLCGRALLLDKGKVVAAGSVSSTISRYISTVSDEGKFAQTELPKATLEPRRIWFTGFRVEDADSGKPISIPRTGMDINLVFEYERIPDETRSITISFSIRTSLGIPLILHRSNYTGQDFSVVPLRGRFVCRWSRCPLVVGRYLVVGCLEAGHEVADLRDPLGLLDVERGDFFGTGHSGFPQYGVFLLDAPWHVEGIEAGADTEKQTD